MKKGSNNRLWFRDGPKRNFLRIHPQHNDVAFLGLWTIDNLVALPITKEELGSPLIHKTNQINNCISLENISAGGLGASIADIIDEGRLDEVKCAKQLLFLFVLNCEKNMRPMAMWTICDMLNLIYNNEKRFWYLGVQFSRWAKALNSGLKIKWHTLAEGECGIDELDRWVKRVYRAKNGLST